MAKKSGSSGFALALFAIFITFICILVSNTLNFKIAATFGPSQYLANIIHFHSNFYGKVKSPVKIYEKILSVAELKQAQPAAYLSPGKRFKFEGYKSKENITWIAAKVFKGTKVIHGYFMVPEVLEISTFWSKVPFAESKLVNNRYFEEIPSKSTEAYRERLNNVFNKKLFENVKIMKVQGGLKIQEIKDSTDFRIIAYISNEQVGYYCSKQEYNIVESLHYRYMGGNFETHYLQANKNYDSGKEGVFLESSFMKLVDKWYFKIGFPIFVFIFLNVLFKKRQKCPNCGSKDIYEKDKNIRSENYKHERKDGERNRRHKHDNPLIREWQLLMACNNCSHNWYETKTVELANGEKILKSSNSIRKREKEKEKLPNV